MTSMNAAVDQAVVALAGLLAERPSGLVTDIDGTISRIALTPGAALVEPEARAALDLLARQLDLVAAVSGRSALDASTMVGLPGVLYVGNHGMERLQGSELNVATAALEYQTRVREALTAASASLELPGVIFEDKGVTASVHFRGAPDPTLAKPAVLSVLAPLAELHGLRLTEGRMVVELRPPVVVNKGTAIRDMVTGFGLRSIVFLGDDLTDLDAMQAVRELRREGRVAGATVGVITTESPQALIDLSDIRVGTVEDVSDLLAGLAARLEHPDVAQAPSTEPSKQN